MDYTSTPRELTSSKPTLCLNISDNDSGYLTISNNASSNTSDQTSNAYGTTPDNANVQSFTPSTVSSCEHILSSKSCGSINKDLSITRKFPLVSPVPSLEGRDHVDFMYHLGHRRNYSHIARKIINYVKPEDLYNMWKVSKTWRRVIINTPFADRKLRYFVTKVRASKENLKVGGDKHNFKLPEPRMHLGAIHNLQSGNSLSSNNSSNSASPPVSPSKRRFHTFLKEGQKLPQGECQFTCSRCRFPAHTDHNIPNVAQCTNVNCNYRWCKLCYCKEHRSKPCGFLSTPIARNHEDLMCTLQSKKNLRRLLL